MAAVSTLERRIDRHMRESNDQINLFKHEIQNLKIIPKSKALRPSSEAIKTKEIPKNKRIEQISKLSTKNLKGNEKSSISNWPDPKALRKSVSTSVTILQINNRSVLITS